MIGKGQLPPGLELELDEELDELELEELLDELELDELELELEELLDELELDELELDEELGFGLRDFDFAIIRLPPIC